MKGIGLHLQLKQNPFTLEVMNPLKSLVLILLFSLPLFGDASLGDEVTESREKKIPYTSLTPAEVQTLKEGEISHGASKIASRAMDGGVFQLRFQF